MAYIRSLTAGMHSFFLLGKVIWFPPLCKLQHLLALILKVLSDSFSPEPWLQVQHATNNFLHK